MKYRKLRARIVELFGTIDAFSQAMGKDRSLISQKLNKQVEWGRVDIAQAVNVLKIPHDEIWEYFFSEQS